MIRREVKESPEEQGESEIIVHPLTTTPWGSSPSSVVVRVLDITGTATDVTSTVMPTNSPSVAGDVITLSPLKLLTNGHTYLVKVKFVCSGNTLEANATVLGKG